MAKNSKWTRIVFRTFKSGVQKGEVIALFIDEVSENYVMAYMSSEGHGDALYSHIIDITRRATPEEVAPLADELHRIGYTNIEVMYRKSNKNQ